MSHCCHLTISDIGSEGQYEIKGSERYTKCMGKCKYGPYCYKHRSMHLLQNGEIIPERFTGFAKDYLIQDLRNYCGKHKKLFKDILDFYFTNKDKILWMQNNMGVGTDQPVVNFFLNKENVECKLLPYEYNMQDMTRFEVLGEDMLHTKYGWVYHFNAGVKPSPGVWLEHTYKYLMK